MNSEYVQAIESQSFITKGCLEEAGFVVTVSFREYVWYLENGYEVNWTIGGKDGPFAATVTFNLDGTIDKADLNHITLVSEQEMAKIESILEEYYQRVMVICQVGEYYEMSLGKKFSVQMAKVVQEEIDKQLLAEMVKMAGCEGLGKMGGDALVKKWEHVLESSKSEKDDMDKISKAIVVESQSHSVLDAEELIRVRELVGKL